MEPSDSGSSQDPIEERLRLAPRAEQTSLLVSHLGEVVSQIVDRPPATEARADHRFFELGLGSLIVVELKNRLEKSFAVELPVALFFKHSTLGEIADHLLEEVLELTDRPDDAGLHVLGAAAETVSSTTALQPSRRIEELSEEEAQAEILAKLAELESKRSL